MEKFIVAVLVLLITTCAFADPPYETMELVFKNHNDAMTFNKAYKSNAIKKYFSSISISESENLAECIFQEYFLKNYKQSNKTIILTVADAISYYKKKGIKGFTDLLIEWSEKIDVKITYYEEDHFVKHDPMIIVNGFNFTLKQNIIFSDEFFTYLIIKYNNGRISLSSLDGDNSIPSWIISQIGGNDDSSIKNIKAFVLPQECEAFFSRLDIENYDEQVSSSSEVENIIFLDKLCNITKSPKK